MTWRGIRLHRRPPTPGGPTWSSRGDLLALWKDGPWWWAVDHMRRRASVGHATTAEGAMAACDGVLRG
jgi:hypothetical protein